MGSPQHLQFSHSTSHNLDIAGGALTQAVIDAVNAHIAVVDQSGKIVSVNRAWKKFARANGDPDLKSTGVGVNYLEVLHNASPTDQSAHDAYQGIASVLQEECTFFTIEYPCNTPSADHWFRMEVSRLHLKTGGAVLAHHDITDLHTAQMEREALIADLAARNRLLEEEQTVLHRELSRLESQAHGHSTEITAHLYGAGPLRQLAPQAFQQLTVDYAELISQALEMRAYRIQNDLSSSLQAIAERVGYLNGGPRDIVDLHREVLSGQLSKVKGAKARALTDEARLMLVKLLCYLAAYYRRFAVGK